MANQQGTLTLAEIGWLAGIIEGEGSITMNVRHKSWKGWQGVGVDLTVCMSNTDGYIVEKVAELFRRLTGREPLIVEHKKSPVYKADGSTYVNPKTSILNISVGRMGEILTVLRTIEPHMVGEKKARARLMIQFVERRMSRVTKHTIRGMALYDKYDWQAVKEFYALKGKPLPPEVQGLLNEHEQNQPSAG